MTKRRAVFLALAVGVLVVLAPGIGRSIQRDQALSANVVLPEWQVAVPTPGDVDWAWDVVPLGDHIYLSGLRIDKTERKDGRAYHKVLKVQKSDGALVATAAQPAVNTSERLSLANTGGITAGEDGYLYAVGLEPGTPLNLTQGVVWKIDPDTMRTAPFGNGAGFLTLREPGKALAFSRVKEHRGKLFAAGFSYPDTGNVQGNTDWHVTVIGRASGVAEQHFTAYRHSEGYPCNDEVNGIHVDDTGVYLSGHLLDATCDKLGSRVLHLKPDASGKLQQVTEWIRMDGDRPALADG